MKPRHFAGAAYGCLCLLFLTASLGSTVVLAPARQTLAGHVPVGLSRLTPSGRLPSGARLNLTLGLPLRHRQQLTNLLAQVYDPASANFHRYVTPAQFAEQFGPSAEDYQAVIAFVQSNGLVVSARYPNRALLDVNGAATDIERTFQVTLRTYRHPSEAREFFAPDTEPSVDAAIPLLDISGLSDFSRPHPKNLKVRPLGAPGDPRAKDGSSANGLFQGQDFRAAYLPGVSLSGAGQSVGLFAFDGYYASDIAAYETRAGLPNVPLRNVLLDDFDGTPGPGNAEVALDIEMVVAMAPGVSQIVVFEESTNGVANHVLNAMATNSAIKQLSCSWDFGSSPNSTADQFFQQFALQGQSFFNASGDGGAYAATGIPAPDDDPFITIVGGTALATSGPGGAWIGETVWNDGEGDSSGGGASAFYSLPPWQQGVATAANGGSATMRNIPDVAMVADNIAIVADNGHLEGASGTSAAAPLWAGFAALANQQAVAQGGSPIGFINPAIYALGQGLSLSAWFNDITTGNNANADANQYWAVPGYDLCSGWGSPNGMSLLLALASPDALVVAPGRGFVANGPAGGPFNVSAQSLALSNAGASSLRWSLTCTSAWLRASATSGSLAPGAAPAAVTLSLSPAADNLPAGAYVACVWLTNLSSGVSQNRQFTLLIGQNLVQNGGFEVGDFSWWALAGPSAQNYNLVDNGSGTFVTPPHTGKYAAALGESNAVAYLSQSLPTRAGQPYWLSFYLFNLSTFNTPNEFLVQWNPTAATTNVVFDQINLGALAWTNLQFLVIATGPAATLAFGARNDPDYFGLDDVSVVPVPLPVLHSVALSPNQWTFSWNALPGPGYQLQYRGDLAQGQWANLGNPLTATGSTVSASIPTAVAARCFFRVQLVQ